MPIAGKECETENLQNCVERRRHVQALFDDGDEHVDGDRDPDLGFDGIFRGAEKSLDAQVLLDPFEKQFHLPAALVELCNGQRRQIEIVGEKGETFVIVMVVKNHSAQMLRIGVGGFCAGEPDGLVAAQTRHPIDSAGIDALKRHVVLGADHEERASPGQTMQARKIEKAAVHDRETARLGSQNVQHVHLMHFAVGNVNERGDVAAQINLGVHLHRSLGGAEMRPRKDAQRKIDGRRVERIDRVGEINPEILISVKLAGRCN